MKVFAVLIFTVFFIYANFVSAVPTAIYDGPIEENNGEITRLEDVDTAGGLSINTEISPIRHRRVTCDVLSITTPWGGVNHAACAARCLVQRHKGGACRDGVCHCRD